MHLDNFIIVAWASDPDLIPMEVGFSVPEPIEPFVEGEPPLFLCTSEIIHAKCDLLHYHAIIDVLEFHNFNTPQSSDSMGGDHGQGGSSTNNDDGYLGYDPGPGFWDSWPRVCRFISDNGPSGEPWPSLPVVGGEVS
jgi:hypothetical protein